MSHNPASRGDMPVPDDDMEISSDAGRGTADDNIDIDIDFDVPGAQTVEDDFMIEDDPSVEKLDPHTSHAVTSDSLMVDGDGNGHVPEHGMVDDGMEAQDEELLDVSDSEEQDAEITEITVYDDTERQGEGTTQQSKSETLWEDGVPNPERTESAYDGLINPGDPLGKIDHDEDEISYNLSTEEDNNKGLLQNAQPQTIDYLPPKEEVSTTAAQTDLQNVEQTLAPLGDTKGEGEAPETVPTSDSVGPSVSIPTDTHVDPPQSETVEDGKAPQKEIEPPNTTTEESGNIPEVGIQTLSEDVEARAVPIGDHDNNSPYKSHSVVVLYEDAEIHLFPPAESEVSATYFLNDETLVDAPLKDLLGEFRNVLGDSVTDNEELELEIGILGLSISESSSEASLSTLSTVLDVYGRLCQLDQILDVNGSPHPLHVVLRTKARFSARISQMYDLIEDGKGLSHLQFINNVAEELQQEVNEDDYQPQRAVEEEKAENPEENPEEEETEGLSYPEFNGISATESTDHSTSNPQADNETADHLSSVDQDVRVAHGSENDPPDYPQPSHLTQESTNKSDRDDDLIDFGDAEDDEDEKDQPTASTTPTLQGDEQHSFHPEAQFQNRDNNTSPEATKVEHHSEDQGAQVATVDESLERTHEEGEDLLEQFHQLGEVSQGDEYLESEETTNFDHHFDLEEDGQGPDFGDIVDFNHEDDTRATEKFQTTEDQWEDHDEHFLEDHENENHDFGDGQVDESEFLHDDEEQDYLETNDKPTADDPTASKNVQSPPTTTSRKRSFAEHDEQGDGTEGDLKRSKAT